jgi:hypothetical protein
MKFNQLHQQQKDLWSRRTGRGWRYPWVMVQTSLFLRHVWRRNMDIKPLLYQSDPSNPDPEDIVICRDYLVGYQMKGAQTLAI